MRRVALLLPILILAAAGCRDSPRSRGGTIILSPDAGGFLDAGPITGERDAGFGAPRDAGFDPLRDGGPGIPRDGGSAPARLTIQDLQDDQRPAFPGMGASVQIENVVVTAVFTAGSNLGSFYVQMELGGPYSGILVFVPTGVPAPTVVVGDRISLTGRLEEYFDVTEIVFETLLARAAGVPLLPEEVTPDSLANGSPVAEAYEGVLMRVSNLTVTNSNPDDPDDFGEFMVTGGMRVDDGLYRIEPRPLTGAHIDFVIGIQHHAFANYKLLPRNADDVGSIF